MKAAYAFLALVTFLFATANLHADDVNLVINGTTVVGTPIVNGFQYTFVDESLGILDPLTGLLSSTTSTVTATYVDALGTLGVFNFTDVCAKVVVLGPAPACQNLALSFTNLTLGDASVVAAVAANINVGVGLADASIDGSNLGVLDLAGVSVAGASGQINFTPVPEPASLSMMATGLLGAAGIVRRRFTSSEA